VPRKERKRFFFGKKKQKTFVLHGICLGRWALTLGEAAASRLKRASGTASRKSLLVLFFRKERLAQKSDQ
jgi:hypothetical protein